MISHELRCIYVHIPRTAGTSIEQWLVGRDWWRQEPSTKHLLASQAREVYAPYWDEYFTFSIVRNPWDRMISCLHFADHFGLRATTDEEGRMDLDLTGYLQRFGDPVVVEHDHRFTQRDELLRPEHHPGTVYGNVLDEDLDYIGRMEDLDEVARTISSACGVAEPFPMRHRAVASLDAVRPQLSDRSRERIHQLYAEDIARFGYDGPTAG